MTHNIWQGQRVRLRAVEPGDWEAFHANDADSESARSGYWIPLPRNGTFGYGIAIFRPHWHKGYAREAIQLVLCYYFRELRYQKVTTSVYDFNDASLALHQSLGFAQEGRLRRIGFSDGKYFDEIIVGMTREEFEANAATASF